MPDTTAPRPWTPRPWTPGPWDLWRGPQYVGGGEDICIGAGKEWLANMDHRRPVCKNTLSPGHRDDECDICTIDSGEISREQLANARLIASAPDQFEALDNAPRRQGFDTVEEFLEAHDLWYTGQRQAAMDKALGVEDE